MLTIDFEASCLPRDGRSFPIEVGIADLTGRSRSWLIRPEAAWRGWTWTEEAEALHGISPELLEREGRPAAEVMAELNGLVRGRRVVADHDLDQRWLTTLSDAGHVAAGFRVGHIAEILDEYRPAVADIQQAIEAADRQVSSRHRAGADALWLATLASRLIPPPHAGEITDRPLFAWDRGASVLRLEA